ncbi:hypothetical protein MAR_027867 [Mya arenaria]|uniref:Uncharacterized protein n=1 Tax=Mya arenaria TaxID=6604 RepID=A0ABY7DEL7_MYAAR|nr:hypothetical protein MAR_027867 [Mya arenaria]
METHPLKKETVRNWVGSALGLRSLRDGLYPFVKTNVTEFHSYLKARVQSTCQIKEYTCTKCTIDTLSINHLGNCPHREKKRCLCSARKGGQRVTCLQSNACGQMYECITEEHVHKSPSWERIDVSRWSCDPFAVASCFCNNPDSGDLELTALVNICLNNKYIRAKIQVSTQHLLDKIRHSRNEIFHQFNYEVSTNDMKRYLGTMKKLLQEKDINISPEAKQGVTAITQLMKGEIHIVNEELCDAINDAKKAVTTDLNELKLKLNDVETLSDDFRKLKDDVQKVQNILTEQENSPILKRIYKLEKGHEQHDRRICDIEKWRKEIDRIIRASQNSTLNGNECKEGKELQQAKKKCMLLTFKCHTLESLGSLLLECLSGKITELFIPMRTALRTKYNCQLLDLEVCLYEKDFLDCLDDISQHLKDAFITENVDAFDSLPIENTDFQMYLIDRARNQLDSRDMIFFSFLEESIQETFVDPLFIRNGQHASASDLQQSIKELQKPDENKCLLLTGEQGMGKTEICRTPLYAWVQKTKGKSRTNAVEKTTAQYSYFQNAAQQAVESIEFVIFIPLNKKQTEL